MLNFKEPNDRKVETQRSKTAVRGVESQLVPGQSELRGRSFQLLLPLRPSRPQVVSQTKC